MDEKTLATGGEQPPVNLLTDGSVWRAVWFLAWPTVLTNVLQTTYGFVDMIFVGRIGPTAIAAVGFGQVVLFLQFSGLIGVSVGTTALVARFYGANTRAEADHATRQSIILAVIGSVLTAAPLILLSQPILRLLNAQPDVLPLSSGYLNIILYSSPLLFVLVIITGAFRGAGDVRTPLYIMAVATVINIFGDWLLIFGIGPFPRLGVSGAAWATVISRAVAVALALRYLARSPLAGSLGAGWCPDYHWFGRILRIGVPAAVQALLRTVGFSVYYGIIGRTVEGTAAVAALTVGVQAESLAFMPGFAFSIAATSMVGQNLGANQPRRAEHSGWVSAGQGALIMGLMGAAFFVYAEQFARLFTDAPEVVALAALYLKINAISEPFLALGMILTGALQGAGETRLPAVITFISMWLIRIPLTWLLALSPMGFGAVGGWVGMAATTIIGGLLTTAYFKWGSWRGVQV